MWQTGSIGGPVEGLDVDGSPKLNVNCGEFL